MIINKKSILTQLLDIDFYWFPINCYWLLLIIDYHWLISPGTIRWSSFITLPWGLQIPALGTFFLSLSLFSLPTTESLGQATSDRNGTDGIMQICHEYCGLLFVTNKQKTVFWGKCHSSWKLQHTFSRILTPIPILFGYECCNNRIIRQGAQEMLAKKDNCGCHDRLFCWATTNVT